MLRKQERRHIDRIELYISANRKHIFEFGLHHFHMGEYTKTINEMKIRESKESSLKEQCEELTNLIYKQ